MIIGIDPGLDGGICGIQREGGRLVIRFIHAMPTLEQHNGKRTLNLVALRPLVDMWSFRTIVGIERQQSMPKQGVASTFQTGFGYGQLMGMLAALNIEHYVFQAREWQKALLPCVENTKVESARYAMACFPDQDFRATPRSRKPHDGMTDAACIAVHTAMVNGV
jgi:hypothetical protein